MKAYADDKRTGEVTQALKDNGVACLQSHLLAPSEHDHVILLLRFFDPPLHARILDLGAGTGAVADIMKRLRPDLQFMLLNTSQAQLDMASPQHSKVCASFHDIPELPFPIDAVMMTYALGHGDVQCVMGEVSRVLPVGGVFFLYDLTARTPALALEEKLDYHAYSAPVIIHAAVKHGMPLVSMERPSPLYTAHMEALLGQDSFVEIFRDVTPTLFRFVKTK